MNNNSGVVYSGGLTRGCVVCLCAGAMDTFARGLRNAVQLTKDGILSDAIKVCFGHYLVFLQGILGKPVDDNMRMVTFT